MKQTFAISWVFSDLIQGSLVLVKERWDWKEDLSRSSSLSLSAMYIYICIYIFSILERSHFPCVGSSSCQLLAIDRDTYNWCGWLRDDYGMTMGWLWDDYGMTMGWLWDGLWIYIKHAPDWGQRSASHRFHKNGGQSSHPRLRSTGKKTWQVLPNHPLNASHGPCPTVVGMPLMRWMDFVPVSKNTTTSVAAAAAHLQHFVGCVQLH